MQDAIIRPLAAGDAEAAWVTAYTSLATAGAAYGWQMPEFTDAIRKRGTLRVEYVGRHDPDGSFVADRDGEIIGVSLATRRGPLWFLSLLAVSTAAQAQGIGRQLLNASLRTLGPAGTICASDDPKALRRYHAAGFQLLPCYEASGTVDRSLLPAITGVLPGSPAQHREFVEEIAIAQRGAPHGPDLEFFVETGRPLYITDTAAGRGYLIGMESGPALLGATSEGAAQALLWTAIAEATAEHLEISWLRHAWAVDVVLAARLSMRSTGSFCTSGTTGPMSTYLPNGGLG